MEFGQSHKPGSQVISVLLVVRWPVGGIRTFMRYVYRRFPVESYRFVLIAPDQAETQVLLEDLAGLDMTCCLVSENPSAFELGVAVIRQLVTRTFNIVHTQGLTSGFSTVLPATLARVPHLLTVHETLNSNQFSGRLGIIKRVFMGRALLLVNTIQTVSHDAQDNLLEFFPSLRKRCVVISSGIEIERFQEAEPINIRQKLEIESDRFLVGFLGRFMRPKGFPYLVDAVAELSKQQDLCKNILVVAFGEGGFVREEKAALQQRGLENYFRFLPFTPNVAGVIKGLDLVVMPSLWEACGLLAMETLICGIPLVASNCIGLREVVKDTPTIVVKSGDSTALAEGIKCVMEQDLRKQFEDYAPLAARRYDVTRTAKEIENLIKTMIS